MKHVKHLGLLLAVAIVTPVSAAAAQESVVVASDGVVIKLLDGLYGELFSDGVEASADSSVLAIDVIGPAVSQRYLVPETESTSAEKPAAIHFEKNSGLTYLLWEGLFNGVHPLLHLTAFDGVGFTEVIQISGNVFADKGQAQLVIVPDSVPASKSAETQKNRTVIYVTWWEESSASAEQYLVPIILPNGSYLGWHPIYRVSDLFGEELGLGPGQGAFIGVNTKNLLRIQPTTGDAVVLGFINNKSGRLTTLEFEVLPHSLSDLIGQIEESIATYGEVSESVSELAAAVHASIMAHGDDFHEVMLAHLADQLSELLMEQSTVAAAVAPGFVDKAGIRIIHLGARFKAQGIVDQAPMEIEKLGKPGEPQGPFHHLKISLRANLPEPPATNGPSSLFLSQTGHEALVAWREGDSVFFVESQGSAWTDPQKVDLRDDLSEQDILDMLHDRALNR